MNSDISCILEKIGPSEESSHHWGLYKTINPEQFAVIKISGGCIDKSLEEIAQDLSYLYKLGLMPTITYGWGDNLTKRLENLGIKSEFNVIGERITDSRIMTEVEKIATETANNLLKAIEAKGGKAKIIDYSNKVFIAKNKDPNAKYKPPAPKEGRVLVWHLTEKDILCGEHNGDIISINTKPIFDAIANGFIPIVSPIGISKNGKKIYNINATTAGTELVKAIDPVKYILVTSTGGVLDGTDKIIKEIVLERDYERLVENSRVYGGMLRNLKEAKKSLEIRKNGDDKSVQIVNPKNLLYELFTHKGAGTYIRKGYTIERKSIHDVDGEDKNTIQDIIESSFGKKLRDNYFGDITKNNATVYIEKNHKGVGIVLPNQIEDNGAYVDIFAVKKEYRRSGLGNDIMEHILDLEPRFFFWRSKTAREANNFYFSVADGHQVFEIEEERYNGFWIYKGLNESKKFAYVAKAITYMQQKPSNFK